MKSLVGLFLYVVIASCTAPMRNYISPPDEQQDSIEIVPPKNEKADTASVSMLQREDRSEFNPVDTWPGRLFQVLPKQLSLCKEGYQLLSCQNDQCGKQVDLSWEHKNHRIKCESISGDLLSVDTVWPGANGEWVVLFTHKNSGRKVYGRTHGKAIAEIACAADLKKAQDRWVGSHVFSKRGIISIINDTSLLSISSFRVSVLDSLLVNKVVWGVTPLPVKPLWLMVTSRATKTSGFIPVRLSWTNTLASEIRNGQPWGEDIFEVDPRSVYTWDDYTWEIVNKRRVVLEMTPEQVLLSWGAPESVTDSAGTEIWLYPSHECLFVNGELASIGERKTR